MISIGDGGFFDGTREELRAAMAMVPAPKPSVSFGVSRPKLDLVKMQERADYHMSQMLEIMGKPSRCICCGGPATACGMH